MTKSAFSDSLELSFSLKGDLAFTNFNYITLLQQM
jgi:hypothetical protein